MSFWLNRFDLFRKSLIFKILFMTVFTTVTAVASILAYSTIITQRSIIDSTQVELESRLNNLSTILDQKLYNLQDNIVNLAHDFEVVSYLSGNQNYLSLANAQLDDRFQKSGPWRNIFVIDRSGKMLIGKGESNGDIGKNIGSMDGYQKFQSLLSSGSTIYLDPEKKCLIFLQPVYSYAKNSIVGYVGGFYDIAGFEQLLNIPPVNKVYLYEKEAKKALFSTRAAKEIADYSLLSDAVTASQSKRQTVNAGNYDFRVVALPVSASGLISQLNLQMVGTIDIRLVLKEVNEFRSKVYVVSVIALILVNLIMILYLRKIVTNPLNSLRVVAQKIASGNYRARAETGRRIDSIGRLQFAINDMALSLINEQGNLEKQVEQKTSQLAL
jgi:HAMP domain-containing protein